MDDPGQLFYNEDLMHIYNDGGRQPFAAFSQSGGVHPYIDPVVVQNLLNQTPPAVLTTPVQAAVLSMLTMHAKKSAKADFMCISETGSGKTYAFLLPAIQTAMERIRKNGGESSTHPSVLIFCHSLPLADLIYERLRALIVDTPVRARLIAGKTSFIKDTEFDIGICSAGRFRNHFEGDKRYVQVDVSKVELLIIDEVDESMKAADDFVLYWNIRRKTPCRAFFFSATMDGSFSLERIFRDDNSWCYQHGEINSLPPTVRTVFWECDKTVLPAIYVDTDGTVVGEPPLKNNILIPSNPSDMVYFIVTRQWMKREKTKFMIFTKKTVIADYLANKFALLGIPARSVHAKKSVEMRRQSFEDFKAGIVKVLVATNQLTRGIDCDTDIVINYDIPTSHTAWIHRSGRVGRNGKKGAAITLIDPREEDLQTKTVIRQIAENVAPSQLPSFLLEYLRM